MYAVEKGIALTLTLSPRRGNSHFPHWKKSLNGERFRALATFSLSLGERAGVRASVMFVCIDTAQCLFNNSNSFPSNL